MATYLGTVKLGALYHSGTALVSPTAPWQSNATPAGASTNGNIPDFASDAVMANWTIGNTPTDDTKKLQWIKIQDGTKTLLICDRNILTDVSWDDLNAQGYITGKTIIIDGQTFKCRVLTGGSNYRSGSDSYSGGTTPNEWDRFITNEDAISGLPSPSSTDLDTSNSASDQTGTHNSLWHWNYMYSWAQETYTGNSSSRAVRGYYSARYWNYTTSSGRYTNIGWRPVLEALNTAPLVSDSDANLGNYANPFKRTYQVNDNDAGNTVTIEEAIDGTTIRTIPNAALGGSYIYDLTTQWASLALGSHTATVKATDNFNAVTIRTWTFAKTNSVAAAPQVISPLNGERISNNPEIHFKIGQDPEGDSQTFKVQIADSSDMTQNLIEVTNGFEKNESGTWVPFSTATTADAEKEARIKLTNNFNVGDVKYIRVVVTDSGSNSPNFSNVVNVKIGDKLIIETFPQITDFRPSLINIYDQKVVDAKADTKVFVTNNALDATPTWEDISQEYRINQSYTIKNQTKTSDKWAVALRYEITANDAVNEISISKIGVGIS